MWAVLGLGGGVVTVGTIVPPFGGFDMRVSAKREGCSEAKPLGDAGREREARAEGRKRPVGAGGGVAPKRRRCSARVTQHQVIHRRRVKNRLKRKG
jgi:hypothetical protein